MRTLAPWGWLQERDSGAVTAWVCLGRMACQSSDWYHTLVATTVYPRRDLPGSVPPPPGKHFLLRDGSTSFKTFNLRYESPYMALNSQSFCLCPCPPPAQSAAYLSTSCLARLTATCLASCHLCCLSVSVRCLSCLSSVCLQSAFCLSTAICQSTNSLSFFFSHKLKGSSNPVAEVGPAVLSPNTLFWFVTLLEVLVHFCDLRYGFFTGSPILLTGLPTPGYNHCFFVVSGAGGPSCPKPHVLKSMLPAGPQHPCIWAL